MSNIPPRDPSRPQRSDARAEARPDRILEDTLAQIAEGPESDLVEPAIRMRTLLGVSKQVLQCEFPNPSAGDTLRVAEMLLMMVESPEGSEELEEEQGEDPEDPLTPSAS